VIIKKNDDVKSKLSFHKIFTLKNLNIPSD